MSSMAWVAAQSACIAIASRLVGAAFRVGETYNPGLQRAGLMMKPEVVLKREAITTGMAWGFAFLTHLSISRLCQRFGMSRTAVLFSTSVIGMTLAEGVARIVAYRNLIVPPLPSAKGKFVAISPNMARRWVNPAHEGPFYPAARPGFPLRTSPSLRV